MAETPQAPSPEEQARQQFRQDIGRLLGDPAFRRVIWHLTDSAEWCRAFGLSSVHRQTNELLLEHERVYFAEGRRSIGVELSLFVRSLDPKAYMQMLNEALGMRLRQPSAPKVIGPPKAE